MGKYKILNRELDGLIPIESNSIGEFDYYRDTLFGISADFIYPNSMSYEGFIGIPHNQVYNGLSLGTCYAESSLSWVEYWVWRKSGIKIQFTKEELFDCALDSKGIYGYDGRKKQSITQLFSVGGNPAGVLTSAYKYNTKLGNHYFTDRAESDNFKLFNELASKSLYNTDTFRVKQLNEYLFNTEENAYNSAIKILFEYGPFIYVSYTDPNHVYTHAWLAIGANTEGLLLVNSYGSVDPIVDKWSNVVAYAYNSSVNCVPMLKI